MGWLAAVGGFLLVPAVGTLASKMVTEAVKPKEVQTTLLLGSAVHALVAMGSYAAHESFREPNLKSFAYGGTWGEGVSAGLLGVAGLYGYTESGKKMLAEGQRLSRVSMLASGNSTGRAASPGGLLGLLATAKANGY